MTFSVRGPVYSGAGLRASEASFERSISRLSSGLRIQSAADDVSGLAISERMRAQTTGAAMATRNVHDAINLLQTADGGLSSITSLLQRARELAVQTLSTGTTTESDRAAAAAEVRELVAEIDRTARTTSFNGHRMLDGSRPAGYTFQVGAAGGDGLAASAYDMTGSALGLGGAPAVAASSFSTVESRTATTYASQSAVFGTYNQTKFNGGGRTFKVLVDGTEVADFKVVGGTYDATSLAAAFRAGMTGSPVNVRAEGGRVVLSMTDPLSTAQVSVTGQDATGPTLAFATSASGTYTYDEVVTTTTAATLAVAGLEELVATGSTDALAVVDDALQTVLSARSDVGALQNRLEHRLGALAATEQNLGEARSRIADADFAKEWAGVVRAQVLSQAGMAMQSQASAGGQRVLQLLGAL